MAVARVAAAKAAAGRWRRCLGDEGGVCLGVCVCVHAWRWSGSGMVAATALDMRCDVRGARAYAVRASCVTLTSCVLCARGVRALCLWRTCIAEVAAAEIACVAGALRL